MDFTEETLLSLDVQFAMFSVLGECNWRSFCNIQLAVYSVCSVQCVGTCAVFSVPSVWGQALVEVTTRSSLACSKEHSMVAIE